MNSNLELLAIKRKKNKTEIIREALATYITNKELNPYAEPEILTVSYSSIVPGPVADTEKQDGQKHFGDDQSDPLTVATDDAGSSEIEQPVYSTAVAGI